MDGGDERSDVGYDHQAAGIDDILGTTLAGDDTLEHLTGETVGLVRFGSSRAPRRTCLTDAHAVDARQGPWGSGQTRGSP